jgi:hypothetical protein
MYRHQNMVGAGEQANNAGVLDHVTLLPGGTSPGTLPGSSPMTTPADSFADFWQIPFKVSLIQASTSLLSNTFHGFVSSALFDTFKP